MKTMKYSNSKENCPFCNVQLQGDPIPKRDQHSFGATHFSKKIGIYDQALDRTVQYKCPDCEKEWKR